MTELLTAAQMRAIEKAAIDSGEVTGLELMERAGRGVVEAIFEEWPELAKTDHRAVVLCGPGNNGGDGFVVARLLKEWGWEVEVFLYGDAGKLPTDAKVNYERWRLIGEVNELTLRFVIKALPFDLWVDGVFGTGLTRPLEGELHDLFAYIEEDLTTFVERGVAIDLASGLCSDSGQFLGPKWQPALTVTFHAAKLGHYVGDVLATESLGLLRVADIGLRTPFGRGTSVPGRYVNLAHPPKLLLRKWHDLHKYHHGHALILSGGPGKGGAARLAARGALRIGAGLVTLGCPPEALTEIAAQLNAIMLEPIADAGVLAEVLKDERKNALCLGPGLGTSERERDLVAAALRVPAPEPGPLAGSPGSGPGRRCVVLDGDALTILGRDPALFVGLHDGCVLTPHAGEFARLFPDIAEKLNAPATKGPAYSKVDATREAAARAGCVVLFKGPDTVIADADGRCSINSAHYERSAPWLATAGSGDVLAGFITGLLARGFAPMQAAETGAWLHVECALIFGPGLIAEDLAEQLPAVFRDLEV